MKLTSRFVVPVDAPVIKDGAVIVRAGLIAALGPARDLADESMIDYGNAVICPGFVNGHTHLELSPLAGQIPPSADFANWLDRLTAATTAKPADRNEVQQAVQAGLAASLSSGVTALADVTRFPSWNREVLSASAVRAASFGEVIAIGNRRHLLAERLDAAASPEHQTPRLRPGISPHAPYTVEPNGMRACSRRAGELGAPLCIHLAETADEATFTRSGGGPLADYLRQLGAWDDQIPVSGSDPVELAGATGLLGPRTILAHLNYVTDADIASVAASGASVAYCPRTHHAFAHPPHRFREMLEAGINVCVGTDSLASNPSLSILDELRFLRHRHGDVSADLLLAMGTLHGAMALGFGELVGSLTVGKSADLAVIPLDAQSGTDRWDRILDSDRQPLEVYTTGVAQLAGRKHSGRARRPGR